MTRALRKTLVVFVHEEFERQVMSTPAAVAVAYNDERVTFAELNSRANQVAHFLRRLGVSSDSRIGICLERSPLMLAGFARHSQSRRGLRSV
jgi:non-ribosomal peptide synthetase component F